MKQTILNGKEVSKIIEDELKNKIESLYKVSERKAMLATIIVGDDPASHMYVKMKKKACERIGVDSKIVALDSKTTTEELIEVICKLNDDKSVDGILLQHPVPKHINERKCFDSIVVSKDVDGVSSCGFGTITMGGKSFCSATPLGIIKLLEHYEIDLEGKHAVVIGRSPILGKPIAMMLLNKNCTVTIAHSKTKDLPKIVKSADIVVACVGKPRFVKKKWIKKGALIVDAGYNEGNIGDVDLENVRKVASAYTPVPGGVGPMTIASLLCQTVESFEKRINK